MKPRFFGAGLLLLGLLANPASAELSYNQNFEGMDPDNESALADDGWLVGANVFDPTGNTFLYNYFAFPAPNVTGGGPAFSGVATGEGGPDQGNNQLNTYNDYNNQNGGGHDVGNRIEANIFRDIGVIGASDVGQFYSFGFDVKQGNIASPSTATAFIKVLQTSGPTPSFGIIGQGVADTTATGTDWSSDTISLAVTPAMVGETLQIGFTNTASNFDPSGVFYDNLNVSLVPEPSSFAAIAISGLTMVSRRRRR